MVLRGLQRIFGPRLECVVAYGRRTHDPAASLALVESLSLSDLTACAACSAAWHTGGAATPLLLTRAEFLQSLDAFPIEFGEIIDAHVVLHGSDPFSGVVVNPLDVRRAVEVQIKSHLLHLRENFIEHSGAPKAVALLVQDSAPGFATLLRRLARLDGGAAESSLDLGNWAARRGLDARVVGDVLALADEPSPAVDATRLFPDYLATVETLAHFVDQWSSRR